MKKIIRRLVLLLFFLAVMVFIMPSYSKAFESIKINECGNEISFYGWFRNNSGVFLRDQDFTQSGNQLATERTWFRGYTDWNISDKFKFWSAIQFAYEPWYEIEKGSTSSRVPLQQAGGTRKGSKEYSEYDNVNDILRECYFEFKPNSNIDIKIGRQIAIWGEALTTRVGDVIHPDDQRYTFAFANLEDTRIPSVMARAVFNINALSSFIELIYNPTLLQDNFNVNKIPIFAVPAAGTSGQRFAVYAPNLNRMYVPSFRETYPQGWGKDARGGFRTNTALGGYTFGISYFHTQEYNPISLRGPYLGDLFPGGPPVYDVSLSHPNKDIIGFYLNKQLTGDTSLPGVIRTEAIVVPNQPFNFTELSKTDKIHREVYIKYLIGYDLSGYFYPSWHKTAPINVTFEHTGEIIPDNDDCEYVIYETKQRTWNPAFTTSISTTWFYDLVSTQIIASFSPWGESGLLMPVVKYTPSWWNKKFSAELRYVNIFGNSNYKGLGILKDKDLVVLTTQFDW
jgi:hypothetical protein